MEIWDLPIEQLHEAWWNANKTDAKILQRLRASISKYGLVQNLVVRPEGVGYEVLSGNQRLILLRELDVKKIPCVIIHMNDAQARLLAQALNHIHGDDDQGLRAELLREVMKAIPEEEILKILPDTLEGLNGMISLGQETIANYLQIWEKARSIKLRNLLFKLDKKQLHYVEKAIDHILPQVLKERGLTPNTRGTALYLICKTFLSKEDKIEKQRTK